MNTTASSKLQKILIMTSVEAEQQAILRGLQGDSRFECLIAGVGVASAAANTAIALSKQRYDLVINAGIAGGFATKAPVGSLVLADKMIAADLGAETEEGFTSLDKLGFGSTVLQADQQLVNQLTMAIRGGNLTVTNGSILTISTVTGSKGSSEQLLERFPDAVAEAMEGFGVATAAEIYQIPMLELRSISNLVGPRDRQAWKIKEALELLQQASIILKEVI